VLALRTVEREPADAFACVLLLLFDPAVALEVLDFATVDLAAVDLDFAPPLFALDFEDAELLVEPLLTDLPLPAFWACAAAERDEVKNRNAIPVAIRVFRVIRPSGEGIKMSSSTRALMALLTSLFCCIGWTSVKQQSIRRQ
jgi:hypothetical protein